MFRVHWLHNLFLMAHSRSDRRGQEAQQRREVHPMLESLEDRITPSTYFLYKPSVAVGNALTADRADANYFNQYINNLISAGQSISNSENGPTQTLAGQISLSEALAALFQNFAAINQGMSSTSSPNSPLGLLQLQLQLQQQTTQHTTLPSLGTTVSS